MSLDLYQDFILDHASNPRNFKALESEPVRGFSSMCGDEFLLYKTNEDIGFTGSGCAISKASFSVMTQMVKGKTKEECMDIYNDAVNFLLAEKPSEYKELKAFSGVHKYPARIKCATLAWRTLEGLLNDKG